MKIHTPQDLAFPNAASKNQKKLFHVQGSFSHFRELGRVECSFAVSIVSAPYLHR